MSEVPGLVEKITYWERGLPNGFGGWAWASPAKLKGRWQDDNELFIDTQGQQALSRARVYLKSDVIIGGYLFNGESIAVDPTTVSGAFEIKQYRNSPPLGGSGMTERRALL